MSALSEIHNPLAEHHNGRVAMIMRRYRAWVAWLTLSVLPYGFPALAQLRQSPIVRGVERGLPDTTGTGAAASEQVPGQQLAGAISGTVVDRTGGVLARARGKLSREGQSLGKGVVPDSDGQFPFAGMAAGPFQPTNTSDGCAMQASSGTLHPGENYVVPPIVLVVAPAVTEVQ